MLSFTQTIGAHTQKYNETEKLQQWLNLVKKSKDKKTDIGYNPFKHCVERQIIFHTRMQNPINGIIDLSGINFTDMDRHYGFLCGNLKSITDYFDRSGEYMLDNWNYQHPFAPGSNEILAIDFTGINLGRSYEAMRNMSFLEGQMEQETPPGWLFIQALIQRNIAVSKLVLKDTHLNGYIFAELLGSLKQNTKLTSLEVDDGILSEEQRMQLVDRLEFNRQNLANPNRLLAKSP